MHTEAADFLGGLRPVRNRTEDTEAVQNRTEDIENRTEDIEVNDCAHMHQVLHQLLLILDCVILYTDRQ